MEGITYLFPAECAYLVARIRTFFETNATVLHPDSDVQAVLTRLRWLALQFARVPQPERTREEKEELDRAFQSATQARDLVYSLDRLERIPPEKLRNLKRQFDHTRPSAADTPGRDTFFELQIAGRLIRSYSGSVTFEEPDIVLDLPEPIGKIGFACKRPKKAERIPRVIEDAAKQGAKRDLPTVVVIGLDAIIHRDRVNFESEDSLREHFRDRISRLALEHYDAVDASFRKGTIAVVLGSSYRGVVITANQRVGYLYGDYYVGFRGIMVAQDKELHSTLNKLFG